MRDDSLTRREFVAAGTSGAAALLLGAGGGAPLLGNPPPPPGPPMPERPLGRTGYRVRLFSLGGQATLEKGGRRDDSIAIVNRAIDLGVNYIDTAAAYGRGISQIHIGEVMATRRHEVFLASKTHDRTRDGSRRLLEESLRLLRTDHLDLWQLHNVQTRRDLDAIFGRAGAIEALQEARGEKLVRFLGITGHFDPAVLAEGISRFPFDTILMALNAADPHHLPFATTVLPLANEKQMGVIAMKIPARGRLLRPGGVSSMRAAMSYTLSQPVSTVIIGCDSVAQLEENVEIARGFQPLGPTELAHLERLTTGYADEAAFFKRGNVGFGPGD